jgi:hypothetical protein
MPRTTSRSVTPFSARKSRMSRSRSRSRSRVPARVMIARSVHQPEIKYNNIEATAVNLAAAGYYSLLNGIAAGTEPYQRVGRQIQMANYELRMGVSQVGGGLQSMPVRFMIVYDKQTNGATFNPAAILDNSTAIPNVWKQYNLDNRDRFVILRDETSQINITTGEGSFPTFHLRGKIDLPTIFNATGGGTITSITTGSLYLILFEAYDPYPLVTSFTCRVEYLDI